MASLNQVTLELKVTGEAQATKALKAFAEAGNKVGTSVGELGRKLSSIEGEYKKINDLNKQGTIADNARRSAINKLAQQLAALTGQTEKEAKASLRATERARQKAEADKRAAQAAEQLARAQRNLEGSVLRQAQAVNQAVQRMDELSRLQAKGAVGSRDMAQAELEIARALARTNGYLKANGALNTQKALAELRAAQATRDAAAAQAQQNAANAAARQGYNQLMASIDPVIAKQQRMAQAIQTVRAAHRAGIITAAEASAALRQYQAALESAALAGNRSALGMNRLGVMTQQAGYQFGDFAVQVQSGTNVMVALGQQATQLVGTLAMLSRSTRNIAIFSALGVAVPVTTAIAGGLMRAKVEADAVYEKFGFLEGAVRGLGTAFSQTGGVIVNILITIYQNLDVFITILGVAGVAAIVKFTAATAAMGTILTATQLLFSGMAGAQLVAASATATLTAAMSGLMVVISNHPIIAAMTAALVVAVAVLYRARDASDGFKSNVEGLSEALKELRDNAKEAGIESARIALGADTGAQAIAMQRVLEIDKQIVAKQARIQDLDGHNLKNAERKLNALKLERDEILKLIEADRERVRVMQSAEAQSSLDAIISSYDKQYAIQVRIQNAQEQLNAAVNLGLISQERSVEIMKDYKDSLADVSDVAGDMADAQIQAYQEYQDLVNGVVKSQEDELALIEEITKYGKDSVEVARLRAEQEGIVKGLVGDALSQYVEMELRIREIEQGLDDSSESQERLNELLEKGRQAQLDKNRANMDAIREQEQELKIARLIAEHGRDSVEVVRARAEQEAIARNLTTENQQKYIDLAVEAYEVLQAAQETAAALQRQVTHQMQIATMQKEVNAGVEEILSYRDAELESLQAQTKINNLILEHGEDSRQVAEARAALERDAFIAKVKENKQLGNNLDILLEAYDAYVASKQAVEDTADAAADIGPALQSAIDQANAFANAIGRAADLSAGIGINTAGLRAEREALESGADLATARASGAAESLRQDLLKQLPPEPIQRSAGLSQIEEQVQSRFNEVLAREQEQELLSAERSARRSDTSDTSGGGGAGAADEFASRVLSGELMEAIQRAQEETALYEEEVKMLDSALANNLITQQEYNSYVLQAKEAYGQAAEGAREYENANLILANTMSDALGDALMSVVDGTKSASDAFSDMARIIIKKAFEMAVINPILNSIFGTGGLNVSGYTNAPTLFANGAAFSGGNVIPFANGGVVGGPTTFPMTNGQTGLMGEAGPEAIMPLKRGKGGKLGVVAEGSSQPVVINQTFQFSANGDDSVKRIIAQEAPKIANLTQKQIMDQRRRGGAMKATFG